MYRMNSINKETLRTASDLNSVERADAIARIARKLTSYVKAEQLNMSFSDDTSVIFSYSTVMKGLTVFTNGKLSNMPNKEYAVLVTTPLENLSKYHVTFTESNLKDKQSELDIAICGKFAEDLKDDLATVNLMPLTRTRKN